MNPIKPRLGEKAVLIEILTLEIRTLIIPGYVSNFRTYKGREQAELIFTNKPYRANKNGKQYFHTKWFFINGNSAYPNMYLVPLHQAKHFKRLKAIKRFFNSLNPFSK